MRRGVTLVELLLVLALLVIIGALSTPLLANSFSQARLRHGGELLRAAWGKTRLAAMQSGETYVFRYEPEGSRYQTAMLSSLNTTGTVGGPAPADESDRNTQYSEADILRLERSELPEGVVFSSGHLTDTQQLAGGVGGDGNWSSPILFFADGTTTDAVVILANSQQKSMRVTLRGLTGISRTSEIGSEATR